MYNFSLRSVISGINRVHSCSFVSGFRGTVCLGGRRSISGGRFFEVDFQSKLRSRSKRSGSAAICTSPTSSAIKSDLPDVAIPEIPITEHMFTNFKRFGDRPALIDGSTGQQLDFPEVRDSIWRTASGLRRNGIGKKDVVMVMSENCIDYVIAAHGILSIGGTITMGNPLSLTNELQRQADDSEATFLMTSLKCVSKAIEISRLSNGRIKRIFTFGDEEVKDCVPFKYVRSDDGSLYSDHEEIDPRTHVSALPYSSGTTGLPKGVMMTHYKQISNAVQSDNEYVLPDREGVVQLGVLPFYHIYAFVTSILLGLTWGQTTVILPSFEPKLFLESIRKYRVNLIYVVPPMVLFLNKHPMVASADLSSLVRIISAAAPIGKESVMEFCSKHKHCALGQGYGMTETGPVVSLNPMNECVGNPASSGKLLPMTELKIVDLEDRSRECEVGEAGEVWTRGPQMMLGYLKKPKETSEMIDNEGWVHTGDIAYIDELKHLYICDRVKELIKYKGMQVPPAELEAVLEFHPSVSDSCVVGVPDAEAGEVPKAFVALKRDAKATAEEIQQYVAERVAGYKRLRGGVEFVREIPRSPSGKIIRRLLRDQQK